jgi:2-(1,2-epoxy-1,2-dihydrophenyl)acetyl-CoA isomerase
MDASLVVIAATPPSSFSAAISRGLGFVTVIGRIWRLRAVSKVAGVIRTTTSDGVATITLDRPEAKNALTVEMRDDLVAAVRNARADHDVRAVLITGAGDAFCAGMDLRASTVSQAGGEGFNTRSTSEALRVGVQSIVRELWELDKPTVAAVNGTAVGPGAHIALACDFVLVHDETRFAWTFSRWGLVVDAGGAYLLPRLVGLPRARAMVLLGEGAKGREAVELGLAYKCVAPDELRPEADALAAKLAAGPTRSIGLSKQLLNRTFETYLAAALELEGQFQSLAATSTDLAEGMAAFREKRDPKFTGR